ncbi:stage II sporulation protein E [Clostridia bacterium]|nr:stage II sporulation protein E [Clostridia bacterium]
MTNILKRAVNFLIYDKSTIESLGGYANVVFTSVKPVTRKMTASHRRFVCVKSERSGGKSAEISRAKPTGFNAVFDGIRKRNADRFTAAGAKFLSGAKTGGMNAEGLVRRVMVLIFSVIAGACSMPFGMNPLGIALICAADKYIFYVYSGLVISLVFVAGNPIMYLGVYSVVAAYKIYYKIRRDRDKVKALAESGSFSRLSGQDKAKLRDLIHWSDTGAVITSVITAAISSIAVGFVTIALSVETIGYGEIVGTLLYVLTAMLFAYLYSGLYDAGRDSPLIGKAGIAAAMFTSVYLLAPFFIFGISIGYIAAFTLTLLAANSGAAVYTGGRKHAKGWKNLFGRFASSDESDGGQSPDGEAISRAGLRALSQNGTLSDMTRGAVVGLVTGIALGDTAGAVTLGLAGMIAGLFFGQSAFLAVTASLTASVSYSVYIAGADAVTRYIPNMLLGLVFYIPIYMVYTAYKGTIAGISESSAGNAGRMLDRGMLFSELPNTRLDTLSDAFRDLSGMFREISGRIKMPSRAEVNELARAAADKICASCESRHACEFVRSGKTAAVARKCGEHTSAAGRLDLSALPEDFISGCTSAKQLCESINTTYRARVDIGGKEDGTSGIASSYEQISKLLAGSSCAGREDASFCPEMSEKIAASLLEMGIESENVIVIGARRKTVFVFGVTMVNFNGGASELPELFSRICGMSFEAPEYILRGDYVIIKSRSTAKLRVTATELTRAASESGGENGVSAEAVNGDCVHTFDGADGYFYGLISDGMGSGKNAALASRLSAVTMEKLLGAGNEKDLTLEMLNTLLLAKNDECFASVDLFECDLLTGKGAFIKAGAAPSFIVRRGKLYKIQSATVPAGIISQMNSEQTKFDVESGDIILMMSDGIISSYEEGAWLLEMLSSPAKISSPKTLLQEIMREAVSRSKRRDDMSLLLLRVEDQSSL